MLTREQLSRNLGTNLERERFKLGYSQQDMAKALDMSLSSYKRLANGDTGKVDVYTVYKLSQLTGKMFYELCGESSDLFQTYDRMRNLSPTQLHFIESLVQFEFDFARNLETVPLFLAEGLSVKEIGRELQGIIAIGVFPEHVIQQLRTYTENIVFLGDGPDDSKYYSVVPHHTLAIELALNHLFANGHRKIAFIGSKNKKEAALFEMQMFAFLHAMSCKGEVGSIVEYGGSQEEVKSSLKDMCERIQPTALLLGAGVSAGAVVYTLREMGISIPEDMSVVACSMTRQQDCYGIPLTAVQIMRQEMAEAALFWLEQMWAGDQYPKKALVPSKLEERGSVRPLLPKIECC